MPYTLDNTFGAGGIVITDISGFDATGKSLKIDTNNKILLGGFAVGGSITYFAIARYNQDGSIDLSFGPTGVGYVVTDISGDDEGNSLLIDNSNNILLGGTHFNSVDNDFVIARYTPDGVLDLSFGTDGYVITDISGDDLGNSLQVDSNNNILLGGTVDNNFAIARYDSSGNIDTNFGTGGYVITDISGIDSGNSLLFDSSSNKILLGGTANDNFALARYDSSGNLDTTFGNNGIVITDISGIDIGNSLLIDSNDKILLGGYYFNSPLVSFAIARYDSSGNLDLTFGPNNNGYVNTILSGDEQGISLQLDENEKILLGGTYADKDFIVARYTSNGVLDTTFDPSGNGYIITDLSGNSVDVAYSLQVDASNNILLGGFSVNDRDNFAIARYSIGPVIPICFVGNTPILTDQGLININLIDTKKHTIDNKKIVEVTKTHTNEKYLVEIKKDALALNVPSKDTILSMEHKVFYRGSMIESKKLVSKVNNVNFIKYDNQPLYNILLNTYYHVNVNNMIAETLYPISQLFKLANPAKLNNPIISTDHKFSLHKQRKNIIRKKMYITN